MKGYVQVYTGDGKGKTTAALGLALRAVGAGKKVFILQFMKSKVYSEHNILPAIEGIRTETVGKPFFIIPEGMKEEEELKRWGDEVVVFPPGRPPQSYVELIHTGLVRAEEILCAGLYDVVIFDEFNMALFFGLISREEAEHLLRLRPEETELVFTGRGAPDYLLEAADLVTEMKEVKHYYRCGVPARNGIEN